MKNVSWKTTLAAILLVTIIFTALDALVHATVEALEVYHYPIPAWGTGISTSPLFWYAVGKFVATFIISSIAVPLIRRWSVHPALRAFLYTFVVITILEVRYLISGAYGNTWHIYNTLMHTTILFLTSLLVYRKMKIFS